MVMCADLCLPIGVKNLALNAVVYGVFRVANAEENTAVAPFGVFVLNLKDKVLVLLFRDEVGAVSLPAFLAGPGLNEE